MDRTPDPKHDPAMDRAARQELLDGSRALGVPLEGPDAAGPGSAEPSSGRLLGGFDRYLALLLRWNARIKLTSVTAPGEVVARHFLDSLAVVPALADVGRAAGGQVPGPGPEAHGLPGDLPRDLVDVGSGAGFPGLVIALVRPSIRVTVVESIHKKAAFLEAVRRELSLTNVEVVADRMESLVAAGRRFAVAVSRATFAPEVWIREGAQLVAPGGRLIAMIVPGPATTLDALAPRWAETFAGAAVEPPYAEGRALLVLSGRRDG